MKLDKVNRSGARGVPVPVLAHLWRLGKKPRCGTAMTILVLALFTACSKERPIDAAAPGPADYKSRLAGARGDHAFTRWPFYARPFVTRIFDRLITDLAAAGESASEEKKIACFGRAATSLNRLDAVMPFLIETTEAEQLVGVGNQIAQAAGLNPRKY